MLLLSVQPYDHANKLWGPSAEFLGFNGVGERGLRLRPGRGLTMELMINLLNACYAPERAEQI